MLYLLGFEAGRRAYRDLAYIAGGDRDAEVKVAQSFFQMLGYGRLENVRARPLLESPLPFLLEIPCLPQIWQTPNRVFRIRL